MRKIVLIALCASFFASCESLREEFQPVFTGKYENPAAFEPASLQANCTIAELAGKYKTGKPWTIDENLIISGIVSTTDQPGNFYKSFYIQDETGGIELKLGKNGLYNDYLPGQRVFVDCRDLCLGMYGFKSSSGNGMVQIGFKDPSGSYETSYLESSLLIDSHIFKGEVEGEVEPVELISGRFPSPTATQKTDSRIGKLVTVKNLKYGWFDPKYSERNEVFVLLYIDSNKDKSLSSNRIFISERNPGITTWAMSKEKMTEYLLSGIWDAFTIGNAGDQTSGQVGQYYYDGTYPGIEKAAYSVSQYFSTPRGDCVQIRTSGYSKFADTEIDPEVLAGRRTINATGILSLYQGSVQLVINSLDDIEYN